MAERNPHTLVSQILDEYITKTIIPQMTKRRGRLQDLTEDEVAEKLSRPAGTGKPGEIVEFFDERKGQNILGIDGGFASEIADLIFYGSQPNCPQEKWYEIIESIDFVTGIPLEVAQEFCIIKYETRLRFGDEPNYKKIENQKLQSYIDNHYPNLKNIWNI